MAENFAYGVINERSVSNSDARIFYVKFIFSARIFYRGVPSFATGCPCLNWQLVCMFYIMENTYIIEFISLYGYIIA